VQHSTLLTYLLSKNIVGTALHPGEMGRYVVVQLDPKQKVFLPL
jgi:hypothetical protein